MTVLIVQSINGLCDARFTVWISGAVDLRQYNCSMLSIGLHVLPGQSVTNIHQSYSVRRVAGRLPPSVYAALLPAP
ncbi:hypothetical protein TNCV_3130881 [Trichonephila clavipes]|nr:hypothetical protein TNCV_3130881 [Trichonephila clavipes]